MPTIFIFLMLAGESDDSFVNEKSHTFNIAAQPLSNNNALPAAETGNIQFLSVVGQMF